MYKLISKNEIKRYRKALQKELSKVKAEIDRINKELEEDKSSVGFMGTDIFTDEAEIIGKITACDYILYNCLGK